MPPENWYIHIRGETFGPVGTDVLTILLRQNRLQFSDWVWNDKLPRWSRLEEIEPFKSLLPEYPNVPTPTPAPAVVAAPTLTVVPTPAPQPVAPPPAVLEELTAPTPPAPQVLAEVPPPTPVPAPAPAPEPVRVQPAVASPFKPLPFPPLERPSATPRPAMAPSFPQQPQMAPQQQAAQAVAAPQMAPQAPAPQPHLQVVPPPAPVAGTPIAAPVVAAPAQVYAPPAGQAQSHTTPPPPPPQEVHAVDPTSNAKVWIRRHMRLVVDGTVAVHEFGDYVMYDMSEGGVFVLASTPIPFGTDIKLRITTSLFPKPLDMTGIVIREGLSEAGEPGFAIQFTRVNPANRRVIQDFVRSKTGAA